MRPLGPVASFCTPALLTRVKVVAEACGANAPPPRQRSRRGRRSAPRSVAATGQSPHPPENDRCQAENQPAATQTRQNELIGTATIVLVEARGRHSHGGGNTNEHEKENVVDDRDPHPADRRSRVTSWLRPWNELILWTSSQRITDGHSSPCDQVVKALTFVSYKHEKER